MPDFNKYFFLPAPRADVYAALTNPLAIQLWSGEKAEMSTDAGSEFSLWEDSIVGQNLEFEENKKIIQKWYFDGASDDSVVTIKLHEEGNGTSMEIRHNNIPMEDFDDIKEGWLTLYLPSLYEFFKE